MRETIAHDACTCMDIMQTVNRHAAHSFARLLADLDLLKQETAESQSDLAPVLSYVLQSVASQYLQITEVTQQQLLAFLRHDVVQGSFSFVEEEGEPRTQGVSCPGRERDEAGDGLAETACAGLQPGMKGDT